MEPTTIEHIATLILTMTAQQRTALTAALAAPAVQPEPPTSPLADLNSELAAALEAKEAARAGGDRGAWHAAVARHKDIASRVAALKAAIRQEQQANKAIPAPAAAVLVAGAGGGCRGLPLLPQRVAPAYDVHAYRAHDPLPVFDAPGARRVYWEALLAAGTTVLNKAQPAAETALVAHCNKSIVFITGSRKPGILTAGPSDVEGEPPVLLERLIGDVVAAFGSLGEAPPAVQERFASSEAALARLASTPLLRPWVAHKDRREVHACGFFPPPAAPGASFYNTWGGFGVGPDAAGNASAPAAREFLHHMRHRICRDDPALVPAVMAWLANAVQNPGKRARWALVMHGEKGAGKGLVYNVLEMIIGPRYCRHPATREQVLGRFTGGIDDALLIFLDEIVWAGDHEAEAVLKKLITEGSLGVEHKHQDPRTVKNWAALLIASNGDWVVPSSGKERRFTVCEVSNELSGDNSAEGARLRQLFLSAEGIRDIAALLWGWPVDAALLNTCVQTAALDAQKEEGLNPVDRWLASLFEAGGDAGVFGIRVRKVDLYELFKQATRGAHLPAMSIFFKQLKSRFAFVTGHLGHNGVDGATATLPPREEALEQFRKATGMDSFQRERKRGTAAAQDSVPRPSPPFGRPRVSDPATQRALGDVLADDVLAERALGDVLAELTAADEPAAADDALAERALGDALAEPATQAPTAALAAGRPAAQRDADDIIDAIDTIDAALAAGRPAAQRDADDTIDTIDADDTIDIFDIE